jgi:hypothetical protein
LPFREGGAQIRIVQRRDVEREIVGELAPDGAELPQLTRAIGISDVLA